MENTPQGVNPENRVGDRSIQSDHQGPLLNAQSEACVQQEHDKAGVSLFLSKFGFDEFVTLCGELRPLKALEIVHLSLGRDGGVPLAPLCLVEFLDNSVRLDCSCDILWRGRTLDLRNKICQSYALDGHNLAGSLFANDIDENALIVDDINNDGKFVSKWAKADDAQTTELNKLPEGHTLQRPGQTANLTEN